MKTIELLLGQAWVQHVGWTLIQFLWQGTLISVAFAIVRGLLGRSVTARVRYALACVALGVMVAAPVLTYFVMPQLAPAPAIAWPLPSIEAWQPIMPWLVTVWLSGVIVFSVRLIGAWRVTVRLRSAGTHEAPPEWEETLENLIRQLRVSRPVRLLISTLVEVPTVVGWLRPVVLVPVSALTGLAPEHITALLAHELAHVRRLDYMVNILQSIAEAVLFYHPAVWWVSGEIRTERELCCDDLAVAAAGGDALTYVQALAEFESYRPAHRTTMAANGGSLLNRMRRLIGQAPAAHALPGPGAAGAMSLLWLLGIGAVAAQGAPQLVPPASPPVAVSQPVAPETVAVSQRPSLSKFFFSPFGPGPQKPIDTAQKETIRVEGSVASTIGGPVQRATVQLLGAATRLIGQADDTSRIVLTPQPPGGSGGVFTQTTDDAGKFVFDDVPPGRYSLQVVKTGFITGAYGSPAPGAPAPQITLEAGTTLQGVLIKLVPQGVISGQVTTQDREPMARAQVSVYRTTYVRGRKQLARVSMVNSDDEGNYRIPNLTPGRYYLGVRPVAPVAGTGPLPPAAGATAAQQYLAGFMAGTAAFPPPKKDKDGFADVITFYPNGTDISSASVLEVAPGARLDRTDIRIRRERVYSLKGRVNGAGGTENTSLVQITRSDGGLVIQRTAAMVRQGTFEVDGLPSGSYVLHTQSALEVVSSDGSGRKVALIPSGQSEIKVGSSNVDGVSLNLESAIEVTGTIRLEEGDLKDVRDVQRGEQPFGQRAGLTFRIRLTADDDSANPLAEVKDDGSFRLQPVMAGRYLLDITGVPESVYVKSIRYNGQEVTRAPLELVGGNGNLDILLSAKPAGISGSLRGDREPLNGVTVAVWPKTLNVGSPTFGMKLVTTDQNGAFQVSGLPPGDYYIAGWEGEPLNSGVIQIPELLARFAGKATSVSLGEGSQATADAKLIPASEIAVELAKLP